MKSPLSFQRFQRPVAQLETEDSSSVWRRVGLAIGAGAATLTLVNQLLFKLAPPPSHRNGGQFDRYPARTGDIAWCVQGAGSPVLLLHGFGAGNSMFEWENVVGELAQHHTVYCFDFPGWGLSDKAKQRHTAEDYIETIINFVQDVIGEPCAVIASSQACSLAIEAADRAPQNINRVILVCPQSSEDGADAQAQRLAARGMLSLPGIGTALYLAIASKRGITQFSREHLFFDKERVTPALVGKFYANSHQHDAPYAVYSFLEGAFEIDARPAWSRLKQPALLVWGRHARLSSLDNAPEWLANKPDARLEVIDNAMLLPHAEHPRQWCRAVLDFLK